MDFLGGMHTGSCTPIGQWRTLRKGGGVEGASPPPIIFTEALVLKSGSTRKFLF